MSKKFLFTILFISAVTQAVAQQKKNISLKDSLDGAFDLSNYIIHAHGFVPVPIIITEPSLGGFGGGLVPVFIKQQTPYRDSIKGKEIIVPVAPDITGAIAAYTANDTWVLATFRSGTIKKYHLKYTVGGGYANVNMAFYRPLPNIGEQKFEFNFRAVPIFLQGIKRIRFSNWYGGLKYLFLQTKIKYNGSLPSFVKSQEMNSLVSELG